MPQLHKKFSDSQVKELFERYSRQLIERSYIQDILGIGKARFFALLKRFRANPEVFSIQYQRTSAPRSIDPAIEKNILKELALEKKLIRNKDVPLHSYNYSYIKDRLESAYHQKVSVPTIITRAKKYGFHLKKSHHKIHDREVLTHYAGELIQHDSSFHLWAPAAQERWYVITSLDDYSRFILYARLLKKESTWAHILAFQTVALAHGLPFSYYVDSHSIFRFVQGRDEVHYKHHLKTDDVDPQWKQVLQTCGVKVTYALSPQAKGKIERPYRWIQDHLVRSCVRDNVTDIRQAQTLLAHEIHRYNYRQVHSTTLEIPDVRFQRALREKQSLFRPFKVPPPFKSVKDVFCITFERVVDRYSKISLQTFQFRANGSYPDDKVTLRLYPLNADVSEIRCWRKDQLLDVLKIKNTDLKDVQF
jgi:hypothetical protein